MGNLVLYSKEFLKLLLFKRGFVVLIWWAWVWGSRVWWVTSVWWRHFRFIRFEWRPSDNWRPGARTAQPGRRWRPRAVFSVSLRTYTSISSSFNGSLSFVRNFNFNIFAATNFFCFDKAYTASKTRFQDFQASLSNNVRLLTQMYQNFENIFKSRINDVIVKLGFRSEK